MPPLERALARGLVWLAGGLAATLPLLVIPRSDHVVAVFLIHLTVVVAYGLGLAWWLAPLVADPGWFASLSGRYQSFASIAALVAIDTGVVALVTLASSAALRFKPSLQFLQLLSALDIAWAGATISIAAFILWDRLASYVGGILLGVFCVFSIWRYLDIVGLGPSGEWLVSGRELMTYVLPNDMLAAAVAVWLAVLASKRLQPTEQLRVQS